MSRKKRKKGPGAKAAEEVVPTDTHRKPGGGTAGLRNVSKRSDKKGGDRLELSKSGKASRKSTRKSKGRVKRTTNLQLRAERKTCSAKARASRKKG